ncbi:hypothetical protein LTR85_001145 [Meristemomyces frigidus]|nr:hypothetical protein LTR85_001145 [Meristemomyces frigidus]
MARDQLSRLQKAHTLYILLVFPAFCAHFKSPTYVRDTTLDLLDKKVCKETLKSTAQDASVRIAIGTDSKFWAELVVLFKAAIPSLERRSFTIWDPSSVDYESTSGALIASNYPTLWKDLERLNDLVSISRNVLTIGPHAQDLAAAHAIDAEIFRLINVCVRVTARGYDGEAGTGEEEKWQWIVNAYKKLLITGLQFLNNLVARNERGKLVLWLALFDQQHSNNNVGADGNGLVTGASGAAGGVLAPEDIPETSRTSLADVPSNPTAMPEAPISAQDILRAYGTNGAETLDLQSRNPPPMSWQKDAHQTQPLYTNHPPQDILDAGNLIISTIATLHGPSARGLADPAQLNIAREKYLTPNAYVFFGARTYATTVSNYMQTLGRQPTDVECYYELARQWNRELREQDCEYWQGLWEDALARYKADLAVWEAKVMATRESLAIEAAGEQLRVEREMRQLETEVERDYASLSLREDDGLGVRTAIPSMPSVHAVESGFTIPADANLQDRPVVPDDLKMLFTASAGARILESGKSELLKRLEGYGNGNVAPGNGEALQPERTRSMSRSPGLDRRVPRMEGWVRGEGRLREGGRERTLVSRPLAHVASSREQVPGAVQDAPAAVGAPVHEAVGDGAVVENGHDAALPPLLDDPAGDGLDELDDEAESEGEVVDDEEADEENGVEDEEDEEEEEEEEEEDDDEEDYPGSTEDGRGLLTDVPLILGPSEIEVLPMLIMSGIVPPPPPPGQPQPHPTDPTTTTATTASHQPSPGFERIALSNLHTVRTHLLLSHSTGRNLLRELLIFVAAWDLREEELYFKFMVKIMEAILKAGLMPFAYHAFRDRSRSKDIISPAQAVVMKLLTCIFRGRGVEGGGGAREGREARGVAMTSQAVQAQTAAWRGNGLEEGETGTAGGSSAPAADGTTTSPPDPSDTSEPALLARRKQLAQQVPSRTDLHILNFIFTEFRQHIIPQTCALIFLQQQIHAGRASPEDFPLNLWDMERMYEGVYQYLEFFAVLTEEGVWKGVLGEWEMGVELVTLLRELEGEGVGTSERVGGGVEASGVGMVRRRVGVAGAGAARLEQVVPIMHAPPVGQRSLSADAALPTGHGAQQQLVGGAGPLAAMEPPFDGAGRMPANTVLPPLPLHPPPPMSAGQQQPIFEAETPLAYPEDAPILGSNAAPHVPLAAMAHPHDATAAAGLPPNTAANAGGIPPPLHSTPAAVAPPDQDEPSDFEWRNLKKLAVLVLSSLIWKNRKVQDQVREYGGLEALVSCCRHDENNPYIREHAIMCLRFAVEGCEENGAVIRGMAGTRRGRHLAGGGADGFVGGGQQQQQGRGRHGGGGLIGGSVTLEGEVGDVPQEVLDTSGYETFMDGKGQVGLRRKEGGGQLSSVHPSASASAYAAAGPSSSASSFPAGAHQPTLSSTGAGVSKHHYQQQQQPLPPPRLSATKMTAEKAAELMQNALRDLPLGDKLVTDKQKAEALAKLDRAFESTEKVLGRGGVSGGLGKGGGGGGGSSGGGGGGAAGA